MTADDILTQQPKATAYSYVRFSTKKQELGDSLRRQVQLARDYADANNLHLSEKSFMDLGVSGFKGKNVAGGALGAFITAVRSGVVAKGSYLLIEQFDRLSRDQVSKAFRLLTDLVEAGITVVTLVDEKVWTEESISEISNVLTSVILMSRAHEESAAKAKRLRSVWKEKKTAARTGTAKKIVTSECPGWLQANEDKTGFIVLEEKAESVRKVFEMRIAGFGVTHIVSRANAESWPVPGKKPIRSADLDTESFQQRMQRGSTWHTSLVGRLLHNRSVLGEYQPHETEHKKQSDGSMRKLRNPVGMAVTDYYPAVVNETTFLRAQAKGLRAGRFPGRRDAALKNWLQGLLRCSCGHSFVRKNKDSKAQPGYARYYCTGRNRGLKRSDGSQCPGVGAKELEAAVLFVVSGQAPQFFEGSARMQVLKDRLDFVEVELASCMSTRDNYLNAIGKSKAPVQSLLQRLAEEETKVEEMETEKRRLRAEIADLSGDTDTVFENIASAVQGIDSIEARAALREELARVIEKVVVREPEGYVEVHLRGAEVPVIQPLRETATLPGLTTVAMTEEEHAAYLEQLDNGEK